MALQGYATQDVNIVVRSRSFSGALIRLPAAVDVIYATLVQGFGCRDRTRHTQTATSAKSVSSSRFALATHARVATFPPQQDRRRLTRGCWRQFIGCYALPRRCCRTATPISILRACSSAPASIMVRHHALGQDLLRQTLRGMQKSMLIGSACVHLHDHRRERSIDRRYFGGWRDRTLM